MMKLFTGGATDLQAQLDRELASRSFWSSIGQAMLLAALLLTPQIQKRASAFSMTLLPTMIVLIGSRFWMNRSFEAIFARSRRLWSVLFNANILLSGLCWGLLVMWLQKNGSRNETDAIAAVLLQAGLSAAATTSLSPAPILAAVFSGLVMVFPFVGHCVWAPNDSDIVPTVFYISYYIFLVAMTRSQYRDLAHRIRFGRELERQKDYLQTVLDTFPGIVSCVDSDLRYRFVNLGFKQAFGEPALDTVGKAVGFKGMESEFVRSVREFMAGPELVGTKEVKIESAIGRAETYAMTYRKTADERPGAVFVSINVQALKDVSERLEQTSKMALLGEMAGGIAHEINNPLTVVQVHAHRLKAAAANGDVPAEVAMAAGTKTEQMIQRITKIIHGLRSFARDDQRDPWQNYNLASVIEETVELSRERLHNNGIELRLGPIPSIEIVGAPIQISQVLLNLLSNARDAVEELPEKWISLSVEDLGEKVRIVVTDSGGGIPEDVRARILHPFFTTKPPGKGTGLGLSISRSILESHGGQIWVNERSPNTQFIVELPKRCARAKAA